MPSTQRMRSKLASGQGSGRVMSASRKRPSRAARAAGREFVDHIHAGDFEAELGELDGNFAIAAGRVEDFSAARQAQRRHAAQN